MSNALTISAVLLAGLIVGLFIGLRFGRATSTSSATDLAALNALLAKSEERLKESESKNESAAKIATQLEDMRTSVERMRTQAQEASEKRIQSETELKGTINEMRQASTSLEQAGLREGHEYDAQRSTTDADSSGIPDVTVKMPGGSRLFIDSKFPFDRFLDAFATEDQDERDEFLTAHTKDLLKHVDALAKRGYHKSQGSPDFVVLFLPFETLLAEALRIDPQLLEKAFKVGVTIATPTSMMALLRTIGHIFTRNKLAESADDITKIAATFLKNLTLLHTKIVAVGKAVNSVSKAYDDLVPTAQKTVLAPAVRINKLGVAGDREKLSIEYPDSPGEVRELANSELENVEDYIDVEIVEENNE